MHQSRSPYSRVTQVLALLIAICGCAGPSLRQIPVGESAAQSEAEKQREMALSLLVKRQDRVGAIAYRLTNAAADFCGETRTAYGLVVHDRKTYSKDYQAAAVHVFGLEDLPVVRYVQPDFPAARAGIQVGDVLEEINGKSLAGKSTMDAIGLLAKTSSRDSVHLHLRRHGEVVNVAMQGVPACDYPVNVTQDDIVNAYADGEKVFIASGMVRFAETDDELALVIGHELSHNALGHISKQKNNALLGALLDVTIAATTGVNDQGVFSSAGAKAFSQAFEAEADYEGLYIAARAGYDISNAPNFWRRMAAEHPGSIKKSFTASHPSTPERFLALESAVAEIEGKKERGEPLTPEGKGSPAMASAPRVAKSDAVVATGTNAEAQGESAPVTVRLTDGSILSAKSVRPYSDSVKMILIDGSEKQISSYRIKTITDAAGTDRTKDVLDRLKRLP